jgi:hypothetical protein
MVCIKHKKSARGKPMGHSENTNFLCTNCGSKNKTEFVVSIPQELGPDAWYFEMELLQCADCGDFIPTLLAELWNDMTASVAKEKWETRNKERRRLVQLSTRQEESRQYELF